VRVLVACEWSGVVRDAFRARGHEAFSCDLPGVRPEGFHFDCHVACDVRVLLEPAWDLIVAFPPCTHLAVSGARYFAGKAREQAAAIDFVRALMGAPCPRIAIENPVGVLSTKVREPDQIIQPWQFGHPESKATCLWLKGLPLLTPTHILPTPASGRWANQTPSGQNKLGPSPDRAKRRGKTYTGVAMAMAAQWGDA
jgi:site-specific DNA-cytosine methylase